MNISYPLSKPLSYNTLLERLQRLSSVLRAIREYRTLNPNKRKHILVKDNIAVSEFFTTAGSLALKDLCIPDAFCIKKLKEKNFDIFGKTNMTELAGFVTTAKPNKGYSQLGGFGVNPRGDFPCGGSSSGSAIAVAAGLCDAALGTETRGSVMKPGLACGVWALKPSRGLISRSGIVPISHNFDTPGVLSRDLETMVDVFQAMVEEDIEDKSTSIVPSYLSLKNTERFDRIKIGLLISREVSNQLVDSLLRIFSQLKKVEIVKITQPYENFDYKFITSVDIKYDLDNFLNKWSSGPIKTFRQLYEFYESHPNTHPFGMDRLKDAMAITEPNNNTFVKCVSDNVEKARNLIQQLMQQYCVDVLATPNFIDWWSISGAPSMVIPMNINYEIGQFGLMLGTSYLSDQKLIAIGKYFDEYIKMNKQLQL